MLKPIVDLYIIMFKDLVYILMIFIAWIKYKNLIIHFFRNNRVEMKFILWMVCVTALSHMFKKGPYEVGWHYIRNVYMYLLIIPVGVVLMYKKLLRLDFILNCFLLLNLGLCLVQLYVVPDTMLDLTRPLGSVGDPIVSSFFNYFLLFKIIIRRFSWVSVILFIPVIICLDAQASVTAFVSVGAALVLSLYLHFSVIRPHLWKMVGALVLSYNIIFYDVARNDLSDRLLSSYFGTIGKALGQIRSDRVHQFENLAQERIDLLKSNALDFGLDEQKTDNSAIGVLIQSIRRAVRLLIGDIDSRLYFRLDSNILSLFKNFGLVGLLSYYFALVWLFLSALKQKTIDGVFMLFFSLGVFFLSFFCATLYKYPISQLLCLFAALVMAKNRDPRLQKINLI